MEKSNYGGMKLPIGYRFYPTDEELIVHYLRRKVLAIPLPASVIPEFDVFEADPWKLPGDLKEKRYFFGRNQIEKRGAGCGYWKPIGKGRKIVASNSSHHVIGIRTTRIFCQPNNYSKTRWLMHQYRLLPSPPTIPNSTQQASNMKLGVEDWVVYRVFQRKTRPKKRRSQVQTPCCSGITNDHLLSSCGLLDEHEINSFSFQSCTREL